MGVAVVERADLAEALEQGRVEREPGVEVVVVVVGDRQQRRSRGAQSPTGGDDVVGGERDVLRVGHARGPLPAAQHRHRQREAHPVARVDDGAAAHQPERGGELGARLRFESEHGAVEERRLVGVVEGLAQAEVVDPGDARGGAGLVAGGEEVGHPVPAGPGEEDRRAVRGGDRGHVRLGRAPGPGQRRRPQRLRPRHRRVGVVGGDRERPDDGLAGAAGEQGGGVEQHGGVALLPALHGLGAVLAGVGEAEGRQGVAEHRPGHGVDADLGERVPGQFRGPRRRGERDGRAGTASGVRASSSSRWIRERIASTAVRAGSDWR